MAEAENGTSMAYNGSGGFAKDASSLVSDGMLNSVCVIQLKENDYLLPTAVLCDYSPLMRDTMSGQRGGHHPQGERAT
ncbi:hypothetical protein MRX96_059052 [Rhipicephalus microplus]